jgi:AraC family transcriptional regulator, activator of mtrCDE
MLSGATEKREPLNVVGQTLWRISRLDLEKLMAALEVSFVSFSECALADGMNVVLATTHLPVMVYCLAGSGRLVVGDDPPITVSPHTLLLIPKDTPVTIASPGSRNAPMRRGAQSRRPEFLPGSPYRHMVGEGEAALTVICGHFHAMYGAAIDLFGSLASPVVECFDKSDRVGRLMTYLMAELSDEDIGGGPVSRALFKLTLLTLLRRALVSARPWVERLSLLGDPPIARAFAEMAARPSAPHTVHGLAQLVGMSRSAFMARFAVAFGEPPMAVLRRLRMRQAASLLAANALSIDQVAAQAGYQSRSSFTRTFRKVYGTDPSEFRAAGRQTPFVPTDDADNSALAASTNILSDPDHTFA